MAAFRTSARGGGTAGTGNRSVSISALAGDYLLCICHVNGNTNDTPTASDDAGGSYDRILTDELATNNRLSAFVRTTVVGANATIAITVDTGSNSAGELHALAFTGMTTYGSTSIRQSQSVSLAADQTPQLTFALSTSSANPTVGAVANENNPAGVTEPTGWTEAQDNGRDDPATGLETVYRDSGFAGTTITWGSISAGESGALTLELNAGHAHSKLEGISKLHALVN